MSGLTKEEEAELKVQIDAVSDKLQKRMVGPLFRIIGGQLGLAAWMTWHFVGHIPAAVIGTVGFIIWALGWIAKFQSNKS